MTQKTFRLIRTITAFFLAVLMGQAVISSNYILATVAIATSAVVIFVARRKVDDVLVDERVMQISGKAARAALSIFSVAMTALALILMFFRQAAPAYELVGSILSYSVCALLLLYSAIFYFYGKQN